MAGYEVTKETRLAIVLYGGVSLAVYINGVCQELLRAVRGTHPDTAPHDGTSERVYRDLAEASGNRLVVDIMSGTSAGGLNAVFLAKALAEDAPLDRLTELWVREGDFLRLLADDAAGDELPDGLAASLGWSADPPETRQEARWWLWDRGAPLGTKAPPLPPSITAPKSLLSGDRFFLLLYEVIAGMTSDDSGGGLVDSIHCYLTTTDLRGVPEKVQLASGPEDELRHRSYFAFRHGEPAAIGEAHFDFNRRQSPVLAFAARATAAHPAAFHPAQWTQVLDFVAENDDLPERLDDFLLPYLGEASGLQATRWLSDGGDMDNKPFTYVLEPLAGRRSRVPVDRRVLYVEPDPEPVDAAEWPKESLPGLSSYTLGAYALGRTETIRQDIEAIEERNSAASSVNTVFDELVRRVDASPHEIYRALWHRSHPSDQPAPAASGDGDWAAIARAVVQPDPSAPRPALSSWLDTTKEELVSGRGWGLWSFEQYRWQRVIDDLITVAERTTTFAAGAEPVWDRAALRELIRQAAGSWGEDEVAARSSNGLPHRAFLAAFDLRYRLRRFNHLEKLLSKLQQRETTADEFRLLARLRDHFNELYLDVRTLGRRFGAGDYVAVTPSETMGEVDFGLRGARDHRFGTWRLNPLTGPLADSEAVGVVTPLPADALPDEAALALFLDQTHRVLEPWFSFTSQAARSLITGTWTGDDGDAAPADVPPWLQMVMADAWGNYDDLDQLILPLWDLALGELAPIEVVRVSPIDSTSLVDERGSAADPDHPDQHKLGGNSLGHFGGFLDEDWRRNDILWGRLDAAEAIIDQLTVAGPARDAAVEAAHRAILFEQIDPGPSADPLAEDANPADRARRRRDIAPALASLLEVNALAPNPRHDHALMTLDRLAGGVTLDDGTLPPTATEVVDAFYDLLKAPADEPAWSVDIAATGARRTTKAKLFDRGARVFGKVLASHAVDPWARPDPAAGPTEAPQPTKGLALVGRLVADLLLSAIPVRPWWQVFRWLVLPLATLAALAGVVGSFVYEWQAALLTTVALVIEGGVVAILVITPRGWVPPGWLLAIVHAAALAAVIGAAAWRHDDWPAVLLAGVSWPAFIATAAIGLVVLPMVAGPLATVGHDFPGERR